MSFSFIDRTDAGVKLAHALHAFADRRDVVVLALPRGGVPVAAEVARMLNAPLDVLIVRKLGVPHDPELAMGAIASGGGTFINEPVVRAYRISPEQLSDVIAQQRVELQRREKLYRGSREAVPIEGKTAILIDDGIATGSSIRVALSTLRSRHPANDHRTTMSFSIWRPGVTSYFSARQRTGQPTFIVCVLRSPDG